MSYSRILTVQDISCVGQCSLTVALPVLSVLGHETAVLPSSLLSNHTTGFGGYTFRDLSGDMPQISQQWEKENIFFSAIYTGYMGSKKQIDNVLEIMDRNLGADAIVIADPAMADNGLLYPGLDDEFAEHMKKLAAKADYLIPNITEVCLLTGTEYRENYDESYIINLARKLACLGSKNIIITGVSYDEQTTGVGIFSGGEYQYYRHSKIGKGIPGTGDLFASVFTGMLLQGVSAYNSAKAAADFVAECIEETAKHPGHCYGPVFEPLLGELYKKLEQLL